MLVKFQTKAYSDITMFGDIAIKLLHLMGHSGAIPSAIVAEDVPSYLARLRAAVAAEPDPALPDQDDDEDEAARAVSLSQRAFPLIELLEAAARERCDVIWKETRD